MGFAGKGEKKNMFEEPPPLDSYQPGVESEQFER